MYSLSQRANAVLALAVTVACVVAAIAAAIGPLLSTVSPIELATPKIAVKRTSIERGRLGSYYNHHSQVVELGIVKFDLEADLRPLFTWNTKQLFVYLVAEYETEKHRWNQVTIWDDIITHKDDALISFRDKRAEYPLTYVENVVNGIKANLTLHWNTVPVVGLMLNDRMGSRLSNRYSTPVLASVQFGKKK
ncbi:signal peptidase 22kDa subunit [Cladochytrium replicatum]|nr:signal peptidase 22kDa subunit [Cladochytrium replicatum]